MLSYSAANLELRNSQLVKARSLLERARLRNPKNQHLWLESIRLENSTENKKLAATRLAQARMLTYADVC